MCYDEVSVCNIFVYSQEGQLRTHVSHEKWVLSQEVQLNLDTPNYIQVQSQELD